MRKIFNLLISLMVVITLCACGKKEEVVNHPKEQNKKQEEIR